MARLLVGLSCRRQLWVAAWVVVLLGCGPVPVVPCLESPSGCDVGVDAGDGGFVDLGYRCARGPSLAVQVLAVAPTPAMFQ